MRLLPTKTETLISKLPAARIRLLLEQTTLQRLTTSGKKSSGKVFQGKIDKSRFLISRRLPTPNNFVPLIKGRIEPTSKGCILFLDYRLYKSAVMFLLFSIIMAVAVGTLFLVIEKSYIYAGIAYSFGIANYIITVASFNRQLRISRNRLLNILNIIE